MNMVGPITNIIRELGFTWKKTLALAALGLLLGLVLAVVVSFPVS